MIQAPTGIGNPRRQPAEGLDPEAWECGGKRPQAMGRVAIRKRRYRPDLRFGRVRFFDTTLAFAGVAVLTGACRFAGVARLPGG